MAKDRNKLRPERLVGMTTEAQKARVVELKEKHGLSESQAVNVMVAAGLEACQRDPGLLDRILAGKTQIDPSLVTG